MKKYMKPRVVFTFNDSTHEEQLKIACKYIKEIAMSVQPLVATPSISIIAYPTSYIKARVV